MAKLDAPPAHHTGDRADVVAHDVLRRECRPKQPSAAADLNAAHDDAGPNQSYEALRTQQLGFSGTPVPSLQPYASVHPYIQFGTPHGRGYRFPVLGI